MKKATVLVLILLGGAMTGIAQEEKNKTGSYKLVPIEKSNVTTQKKMTAQEEIDYCNSQIEAINTKEAWIRQNPEELEKANKNGWFINADKNRDELRKRITELKK